ncbi:replication protein P [Ralstonia sp. 25C]|uniref:replication protein P n=1 Tax=Ralstonia sp. 25C TaxID=3447363 RepID=UPI003F74AF09
MNAPANPAETMQPASRWLRPHPSLGISWMDHLYNRLDGAYPGVWRQRFQSEQAIANWRESWVEAFEEAGLSPDEVRTGLKFCRAHCDWPPSAAEFIKACRPEINVDAAMAEACLQLRLRAEGLDVWSHPAVYWAATRVGQFDMLNQSLDALRNRFAAALAEVMCGEVMPVPKHVPSLPAPGKAVANPERVAAEMAKVRCILGKRGRA